MEGNFRRDKLSNGGVAGFLRKNYHTGGISPLLKNDQELNKNNFFEMKVC